MEEENESLVFFVPPPPLSSQTYLARFQKTKTKKKDFFTGKENRATHLQIRCFNDLEFGCADDSDKIVFVLVGNRVMRQRRKFFATFVHGWRKLLQGVGLSRSLEASRFFSILRYFTSPIPQQIK